MSEPNNGVREGNQAQPQRGQQQQAQPVIDSSSPQLKSKLLFGGRFGQIVGPRTHRVEQAYPLHKYQTVIIAKNKENRDESIAMRLRLGRLGYSQWLNELQVYLLPNFNHEHIVPFLGCDKRLKCGSQKKDKRRVRIGEHSGGQDERDDSDFVNIEPVEDEQKYFDTEELLKDVPDDPASDYEEPQIFQEFTLEKQQKELAENVVEKSEPVAGFSEAFFETLDESIDGNSSTRPLLDGKADATLDEPSLGTGSDEPHEHVDDSEQNKELSGASKAQYGLEEQGDDEQTSASNGNGAKQGAQTGASGKQRKRRHQRRNIKPLGESGSDDSDQESGEKLAVKHQQEPIKGILKQTPVNIHHRGAYNRKTRFSENPRTTIEYWILNDFSGCITLRHYLMMHVLTWAQMIHIARGILFGLHYLHEYGDYQNWNQVKKVDSYIRSTNGALKKVAFKEQSATIHMKPHLACAIIHRNLSSLNIVLKAGLTPCIWNFGQAYICHPFQPLNHDHIVDWPIMKIHESSPYSPPEVLQGKGYMTLNSMKALDIYACGILFWELMSRCCLPKMLKLSREEHCERHEPEPYMEPFAREFGDKSSSLMLQHAVCKHRARPQCKQGWLIGKKSNHFVQTFRELWDQDSDARLHVSTVIDRLTRISTKDRDRRCKYPPVQDRGFDIDTMWPPTMDVTQAPLLPLKKYSNICYESLEDQ